MVLTQEDRDRFQSGVGERDLNDCRLWLRGRNSKDYGQFWLNGKMESAHRVAWFLVNGPIPDFFEGLPSMICHSCDNPPCCNPNHLFLGNNVINKKDSVTKGRQYFPRKRSAIFSKPHNQGELHPKVAITNFQAKEIKERCRKGETQIQIAEVYGVSQPAVSRICSGKRWSHTQ